MSKADEQNDTAAVQAWDDMAGMKKMLDDAKKIYEEDMAALRDIEVTDFYGGDGTAENPGVKATLAEQADIRTAGVLGNAENAYGAVQGDVATMGANERYDGQSYTAQQTNQMEMQRGAATGLTNVFNNMQVSTAGANMANQEADQALAASQDLAMQTGSGAGGATALAAAAAKSKQGISADIDRQVKANEQMRLQGESSLQRELLAQGNQASQFNVGQQQFNTSARNVREQFGAQARNTSAQFNAGQTNQRNSTIFGAENDMTKFNAGLASQNQLAQFQAAENASAANNQNQQQVNLQNSITQTNTDLAIAGGQSQAESDAADVLANLVDISTNDVNEQEEAYGENWGIANMPGTPGANSNSTAGGSGSSNSSDQYYDPSASDRRLKRNITLIGRSPKGLNIYSFEYKNDIKFGKGLFQGIMSDEIPKTAVIIGEDGFDRVDYSKIDVEFKSISK